MVLGSGDEGSGSHISEDLSLYHNMAEKQKSKWICVKEKQEGLDLLYNTLLCDN
jgi:hypothetical protein